MKAQGSSDVAVVEFVGRVQRMARIHQEGLSDKPNRFSREVKYDARPLLGFSTSDKHIVEEVVTAFLSEWLVFVASIQKYARRKVNISSPLWATEVDIYLRFQKITTEVDLIPVD